MTFRTLERYAFLLAAVTYIYAALTLLARPDGASGNQVTAPAPPNRLTAFNVSRGEPYRGSPCWVSPEAPPFLRDRARGNGGDATRRVPNSGMRNAQSGCPRVRLCQSDPRILAETSKPANRSVAQLWVRSTPGRGGAPIPGHCRAGCPSKPATLAKSPRLPQPRTEKVVVQGGRISAAVAASDSSRRTAPRIREYDAFRSCRDGGDPKQRRSDETT